MNLDPLDTRPPGALPPRRAPATPEETAHQFEEIFLKQFVAAMTEGLFEGSLAGDGAPGATSGYADLQRDALNDALAGHLAEQGNLRLADLMLRQWKTHGPAPDSDSQPQR